MPYRVRSTDVWYKPPGVVAALPAGGMFWRAVAGERQHQHEQRRPVVYAAVPGSRASVRPRLGWTF